MPSTLTLFNLCCNFVMETVVHKLPSFKFLNPTSSSSHYCSTTTTTTRTSKSFRAGSRRRSFSISASASAVREDNPALGSLSLGHITRPDFPILHQVTTRPNSSSSSIPCQNLEPKKKKIEKPKQFSMFLKFTLS